MEGAATDAVSGLKLTAANYTEAVEISKRRKQQIIAAHMDVLLNLEAVSSQFNLKGIRHLHSLIETQVRSLKSLGVTPESYGTLLSSVLLNKLPQELRLIVSRKTADNERVMKVVEKEIEAREQAATTSSQSSHNHLTKRHPKDLPTATALTSATADPRCSYCGQSHSSSDCKSITDPAERKKVLKKAGRCFVCLRRHHLSRDCRSTLKCANCNGRHHASICMKNQPRGSENAPADSRTRQAPSTGEPSTSAVHYVSARMPVLLPNSEGTGLQP